MELIMVALLTPVALWLGNSGVERALLIGCLILVLIVELLNSAIEATVDRISFESHRLAKRAKDIGSAAVMLSLVNAGVVWLLIILS
jgi:diacylglycerol kinase (ATP)